MKLTELIVSIAIFLLSCTAFLSGFVTVRKSSEKVSFASEGVSELIQNDLLLRSEIKKIRVPYWKNFDQKGKVYSEKFLLFGTEKGIELTGAEIVYDSRHRREGLRVEWKFGGKDYVTQEFIKQRIIDEKK